MGRPAAGGGVGVHLVKRNQSHKILATSLNDPGSREGYQAYTMGFTIIINLPGALVWILDRVVQPRISDL